MQTHRRRKLEIIVESAILKRTEAILTECGVHVFTVLDGSEGRGLAGRWEDENVADALEQRMIVAVTTTEADEKVFARMAEIFARYPGVIYASDVDVLRAERF
jgi:nitrogen regulatory protein PII